MSDASHTVDPRLVKAVWFRRWGHSSIWDRSRVFAQLCKDNTNATTAMFHLRRELQTLSDFLFAQFPPDRWLGSPWNPTPNKLHVLTLAASCGLDVPATIISNDIRELLEFVGEHPTVITKPIGETLWCAIDEMPWGVFTSLVHAEQLKRYPGAPFPTLLQECLPKAYDVRTFYLDGDCYSMAIFSQQRQETSVDFRRYQYRDPNRTVPYSLPDRISSKVRALMKLLRFDTGSIDMVRTIDGRIVFLEVNPAGQFGMVSQPCNYYLERKVALALVRRMRMADTPEEHS